MGLLYLKNEEKQLYSAYGLTVYGRQDRYEWTIFDDKLDENAYTSLRIERNREEIYNRNLGNRCIFEENFNRTIDNFLWWISNDKPDDYDVKTHILKCLCSNNCLFNTQIENRKRKEEREKAEKDRSKKLAEERKEKVEAIKRYCKNKHLVFCQNWRGVYLFEVNNERAKETLESADSDRLDSYVNYMKKNSVVDARLVADGNLDDIYEYIRR